MPPLDADLVFPAESWGSFLVFCDQNIEKFFFIDLGASCGLLGPYLVFPAASWGPFLLSCHQNIEKRFSVIWDHLMVPRAPI